MINTVLKVSWPDVLVDRIWENPYNFTLAATGTLFKGRQHEIQQLIRHLESGTHIAVHGLQRMGKTSLVREALKSRIPPSSRLSRGFNYAEIELQKLGSDRVTYKDLLEEIVAALLANRQRSDGLTHGEITLAVEQFVADRGGHKRGRSKDLLSAYEKALELLVSRSEQPFVLFLDEFSEICRKIESNERKLEERDSRGLNEHPNEMLADVALMRFFSSLLKNERLSKRLTFIFAVRPFVSEFDRTHDLQILKLTAPVRLCHLDEAAAKALIQEPVKGILNYQPGAVDYLYRLTDGHPYLIQFMLNEIVSEVIDCGGSNITISHVKALEERMIQNAAFDPQFEVLDSDYSVDEAMYGKKSNVGRGVLSLIAKQGHVSSEGWVSEESILSAAELRGLTAELTADTLDQLHRAWILQEKEIGEQMYYRVAIPLLRKRYVKQNLYLKYFVGLGRAVIRR